jgi:hypothetical protein
VSYTTLGTTSIFLALAGVAVAVVAVILLCARRGRWAYRALTLVLVVLSGAGAAAFLAAAEGDHDLRSQTHRVLALAASAERAALARSGRYTTSIARLQRLSSELAEEIRVDGASVQAHTDAIARWVRLQTSLGFGTKAELTLHSRARSGRLIARRPARSRAAGRSVSRVSRL